MQEFFFKKKMMLVKGVSPAPLPVSALPRLMRCQFCPIIQPPATLDVIYPGRSYPSSHPEFQISGRTSVGGFSSFETFQNVRRTLCLANSKDGPDEESEIQSYDVIVAIPEGIMCNNYDDRECRLISKAQQLRICDKGQLHGRSNKTLNLYHNYNLWGIRSQFGRVSKPLWGCSESRSGVNAGICKDALLNSDLSLRLDWNRAGRIIDYEPNKQYCDVFLQACAKGCHYGQVSCFLSTCKYAIDVARGSSLKHLAIGMVPSRRWKYWAVRVKGFIFYPRGDDCVHSEIVAEGRMTDSAVRTKISICKHWNINVSLFYMVIKHRGKDSGVLKCPQEGHFSPSWSQMLSTYLVQDLMLMLNGTEEILCCRTKAWRTVGTHI
jgi:hypothetical protein